MTGHLHLIGSRLIAAATRIRRRAGMLVFGSAWTASRERLVVSLALILIVLFRSAMFVFERSLDFDADQAIFGLMAKHLVEGKAFPLFMYGQNYILAVEAWLAAPIFLLFGASVAALKLPLLGINIAVGLLLVRLFEREFGLRPVHGLVASLFFVLAPPGTAGTLLAANGGNVEPFLYVLLLWIARRRALWFGLVAGLGFLHREFTIYGVMAVITIEAAWGIRGRPEAWRPLLGGARVAVETWLVVQFLRPLASAAGPGTAMAAIGHAPSNNLVEVFNRSCFDASTFVTGVGHLVTIHWPQLFGTKVLPAYAFGLESGATQGLAGSGVVLGAAMLVMLARVAMHASADSAWWRRYSFCVYLMLVGGLSAGMYVVARCGTVSAMRYDMLSILGAVGLVAWFLSVERSRWMRGVGIAVIVAWAAISAVPHGRIWAAYVSHPPVAAKAMIIRHLEARGIKYATSDYWIAYYVTFMTNERIIVAADVPPRISEYARQVEAHRAQAIRISRLPCEGGKAVLPGIYFCPLE